MANFEASWNRGGGAAWDSHAIITCRHSFSLQVKKSVGSDADMQKQLLSVCLYLSLSLSVYVSLCVCVTYGVSEYVVVDELVASKMSLYNDDDSKHRMLSDVEVAAGQRDVRPTAACQPQHVTPYINTTHPVTRFSIIADTVRSTNAYS